MEKRKKDEETRPAECVCMCVYVCVCVCVCMCVCVAGGRVWREFVLRMMSVADCAAVNPAHNKLLSKACARSPTARLFEGTSLRRAPHFQSAEL